MTRKIGLLSYHTAYNYGTLLQAYALARVINESGYDAEYMTYKAGIPKSLVQKIIAGGKYLFSDWHALYKKLTTKSATRFWNRDEFVSTKKGFDAFIKEFIPHSMRTYTPINIYTENLPYDSFIVGSDQTWSPYLLSEKSPFFLQFVKNAKLKNAYAPSLGTAKIPDDLKPIYLQQLRTFNKLSCREKAGCKVLEDLLKRKVEHVLDPTFLLNPEQWDELAIPYKIDTPYILSYLLGEKKCVIDFAEKLGKDKGLPVYFIVTSPFHLQRKNKLFGVTPPQFVYLIKNAQYVCTDSFHGTIFSINYKKNFYSFMKREGGLDAVDNYRIHDILSELSLCKRFKADGDDSLEPDIDYTNIAKTKEKLRDESLRYLNETLQA